MRNRKCLSQAFVIWNLIIATLSGSAGFKRTAAAAAVKERKGACISTEALLTIPEALPTMPEAFPTMPEELPIMSEELNLTNHCMCQYR